MASLASLVTALLVFHRVLIVGPDGPSPLTMDRDAIIQSAHQTCRKMIEFEELKERNVDLAQVVTDMVTVKTENRATPSTANAEDSANAVVNERAVKIIRREIDVEAALKLFISLCSQTPDGSVITEAILSEAKQGYKDIIDSVPPASQLREEILRLKKSTQVFASGESGHAQMIGLFNSTERNRHGTRRIWVSLDSLPDHVPKAWVSAEDKNFWEHIGVDPKAIMRAFIKMFMDGGSLQGGSTITQQVAKNLLVGDKVSFNRKLREVIAAQLVEQEFTKHEILEIYLNYIFLGRNAHGVGMAAHLYFGKPATQLTLAEAATLAGITHGPNNYDYLVNPEAYLKRRRYVFGRLEEDNAVMPGKLSEARRAPLGIIPRPDINNEVAPYFLNSVFASAARFYENEALRSTGFKIDSTLDPEVQEWSKRFLQEQLFRYEGLSQRNDWRGAIRNVQEDIDFETKQDLAKAEEAARRAAEDAAAKENAAGGLMTMTGDLGLDVSFDAPKEAPPQYTVPTYKSWQKVLLRQRKPLKDVNHWKMAVILESRGADTNLAKIGLPDGSEAILRNKKIPKTDRYFVEGPVTLRRGDLVYVAKENEDEYTLRQEPMVQGAMVVMEHATGRVRALQGGFSFGSLEFNIAVDGERQPGSLMKAFGYLAAYQAGIQPNYLVDDRFIYLPKIGKGGQPWQVNNYDLEYWGYTPMARGLDHSKNAMTAQIMRLVGLDTIREIAKDFGIYDKPERHYPFVIGSDETSLLRMVTAYSQIANGGNRIEPIFVDKIRTHDDYVVYDESLKPISAVSDRKMATVDSVSLFQVSHNLQSVVRRGTSARFSWISNMLAGKTGTTDDFKDAWFVGYTHKHTFGVWVGYEKKRSLESGFSGSQLALPVVVEVAKKTLIRDGAMTESNAETPSAPDFAYINRYVPEGVEMIASDKKTGLVTYEGAADSVVRPFRRGYSSRAVFLGLSDWDRGLVPLFPQIDPATGYRPEMIYNGAVKVRDAANIPAFGGTSDTSVAPIGDGYERPKIEVRPLAPLGEDTTRDNGLRVTPQSGDRRERPKRPEVLIIDPDAPLSDDAKAIDKFLRGTGGLY